MAYFYGSLVVLAYTRVYIELKWGSSWCSRTDLVMIAWFISAVMLVLCVRSTESSNIVDLICQWVGKGIWRGKMVGWPWSHQHRPLNKAWNADGAMHALNVCVLHARQKRSRFPFKKRKNKRCDQDCAVGILVCFVLLCFSFLLFFFLLLILRSQKQCSSILYVNSLLQSNVRFNHLFNSWSLIKFEQKSIQSIVDMRPPWGWKPCHYELWR